MEATMSARKRYAGSATWVERLGTAALLAWWVLAIGGLLS
jgi:hypothetical protein